MSINPSPKGFPKLRPIAQKPGYEFKHFKVAEIEQFAADFIEIYNDGWRDFENFVPIVKDTILESFRKMKPLMDEKLIWFAYVNGDPASLS